MADNSDYRRNPEDKVMNPDRSEPLNDGIIELSEMTVGISPEDEAIIDLTEEIVGGALAGFSGVTGVIREEEETLDLSEKPADISDAPFSGPADKNPGGAGDLENMIAAASPLSAIENDIAKELDNYFQLEEETQDLLREPSYDKAPSYEREDTVPVMVSHDQFDAALERVVRKVFGDKIERILNQVIERTVSDEIENLKEMVITRGVRQD